MEVGKLAAVYLFESVEVFVHSAASTSCVFCKPDTAILLVPRYKEWLGHAP